MKIREIFEESGWNTDGLDKNPTRERILDGQLARLERIGWEYWEVCPVRGNLVARVHLDD
jgi:hypothetical protein